MKIKTSDLKQVCSVISQAIDKKGFSVYSGSLALEVNGDYLYLTTTDREIYAQVRCKVDSQNNFKATIQSDKFIQLISKISSEETELVVNNLNLVVKANGEYIIPLIYNQEGSLLELPTITITPTLEIDADSSSLKQVLTLNGRELAKNSSQSPTNYYLFRGDGVITYNSGVCYNKTDFNTNFEVLLSQKLVALFKLFNDNVKVYIQPGDDQTVVKLASDDLSITSYVPGNNMLSKVPTDKIELMLNNSYKYKAKINRQDLVSALDRVLIFSETDFSCGLLTFENMQVTIQNSDKTCSEIIKTDSTDNCIIAINLKRLRTSIANCQDEEITLEFGDERSIKVVTDLTIDVIPRVII